ncbi:MAG TPA: BTAD domain-containing putative transcriptional regulator, partial [Actinoplanes sp.]|nr:BTAD domain-containing putative transcriptional regulator [Actinoplanes sp.]
AEHPLHEGLSAALIRALSASGQSAKALGVYAATRQRLEIELGTEPGPDLRVVHRSLLKAQDREANRVTPAQLPPAARTFVGRAYELDRLDEMLAGESAGPPIVVVSGTAGVGKTALAVTAAHRVHDRFPDGQLYVDLRGYDSTPPLDASSVLAGFLTALGVASADIPFDLEQRAARFRTEVAQRRVLLVLDNAASAEQVRPLLPGSPSCAVLVTSRNTMVCLVALYGAHRLMLDVLSAEDAYTLLQRLIGASVDDEAPAAYALAELCARLPLALRMASELAVARPGITLSWLVTELRDRQERLSRLDADGDPRAGVSAVFSWSLRRLPAPVARTFRLLGLYPGEDFGIGSVAVLAGLDTATARRHLDTLAGVHLITPTGPDRYLMHDLLRAYALSPDLS